MAKTSSSSQSHETVMTYPFVCSSLNLLLHSSSPALSSHFLLLCLHLFRQFHTQIKWSLPLGNNYITRSQTQVIHEINLESHALIKPFNGHRRKSLKFTIIKRKTRVYTGFSEKQENYGFQRFMSKQVLDELLNGLCFLGSSLSMQYY